MECENHIHTLATDEPVVVVLVVVPVVLVVVLVVQMAVLVVLVTWRKLINNDMKTR